MHDTTVMARNPVLDRLIIWLQEGGYRVSDDPSNSPHGGVLITYYAEIRATRKHITDDVLRTLAPRLWLQLGPLSVETAHGLHRQALAAGVAFTHAPFFGDPALTDRPACLVYGHGRHLVTSRPSAASLLDAISWNAVWTGSSLDEANDAAEQAAAYSHLGDYALSASGPRTD